MKFTELIEVEDNDYSNLTESEREDLFCYSIMLHTFRRIPRKMKKQMKKRYKALNSKVIHRTTFKSQKEIDDELPF